MKRLLFVFLTAALTCLMVVPVLGADKLIVKDSSNPPNTVFVVQDTGNTGIGTPTPTAPLSIVSPGGGNLFTIATTAPIGGAGFQFNVPSGGSWNFKATGDNGFKIRDAANSKDVLYIQPVTGRVGIGTLSPGYLLDVTGQIRVQTTVYSSSRTIKDNISDLKSSEALEALKELNPVKYNYKNDPDALHIGFIAEDVPSLVAQKNRDAIDPMDIVAVLTKVVQEQRETLDTKSRIIEKQEEALEQQQKELSVLSERLERLEREVHLKGTFASKNN